MMELKIITFNLYNYRGNINKFTTDYLHKYNPHIICTQEDKNGTNNPFGNSYTLLTKNGINFTSETVGVYYNNQLLKKNDITNITNIFTEPKNIGCVRRNFTIFTVKGICICNVHLEGGRNVDGMILYDFDNYMSYKMEIFNYLINYEKVDIICGDFNSIYCHNIRNVGECMEKQIKYFYNFKYDLNANDKINIKKWNIKPHSFLMGNNYSYCEPEYKTNRVENLTTSRGESRVDFFYMTNKLYGKVEIDCNIIHLGEIDNKYLFGGISDHQPVFLSVKL
jgi:exonuclease III